MGYLPSVSCFFPVEPFFAAVVAGFSSAAVLLGSAVLSVDMIGLFLPDKGYRDRGKRGYPWCRKAYPDFIG